MTKHPILAHRLLLNLTDKIDLKRSNKYVALILSIYYASKNKKCHTKTIDLKYQLRHRMENFN